MTFYHGTNMLIGKIDLARSRNRVDFGKGFYLTDKIGTARDWAIRKVELEGEGIPTVISYEINPEIFTLFGSKFSDVPELDWLEFICANRRINPPIPARAEPRHNFNWVTGPIANDKVVDVVAEYMRNETIAEEAITRLKALPKTYQISLHTSAALDYINDVDVQYRQLKKGRWTQNWIKRKAQDAIA